MVQLLMTVVGVVLLAGIAVAGVNYVGYGAAQRYAQTQVVSAGFQAWERAYAAYRIANRAAPAATGDLLAFLPGGSPKAPDGLAWGYGRDAGGPFVCLYGTVRTDDFDALRRLGDASFRGASVPPSAISYGQACGTAGSAGPDGPFAVTYRLGG